MTDISGTTRSGTTPSVGTATSSESITIRRCESLEDMQACVSLQKEVWKFADDADLIPTRVFVLATKIGGHVIGAFANGDSSGGRNNELAGFAIGIPGVRNGHAYLHSQMLAVRQQYRNAGLGRRIKLHQREDAMALGFELMEWTFDPLEIKNAYLNIEKLGAISRRYNVNQYGITSSVLQGGLPTDRLVAEWWLKSKRVEATLAGVPRVEIQCRLHIDVPAEIYGWKAGAGTRAQALDVLEKNRSSFLRSFSEGMSVLDYKKNARGDGQSCLGEWDESLHY